MKMQKSLMKRNANVLEKNQYLFPNVFGSELISRWDMQETPPDILVTNTSMLSIMLSREVDHGVFENTKKWLISDPNAYFYLVLDELHLIRGSSGTEIAGLIRYLIHRLGLDQPEHRHKLRILASSASLPTEGSLAKESLNYLNDFFGSNGLYKNSADVPNDNQWLMQSGKANKLVLIQYLIDLMLNYLKHSQNNMLNQNLIMMSSKITDKAKAIEYLASSFETNLTDIFNNLHLSQSLFIEKLQALVEYISNLLNSYCFDIKIIRLNHAI